MSPVRIIHWMIFLAWFLPGTCVLLHPPNDITSFERHLLRGIVKISMTYFTNSSPLMLLTSESWHNNTLHNKLGDAVFREIHAVTDWPVLTFSTHSSALVSVNTTRKYGAVIILLNKCVSLEPMTERLATALFWNPRARYVIVSTATPTSVYDQRMVTFSVLKYFNILYRQNAIFLIQEPVQRNNSEASFKPLAVDIFAWSLRDSVKNGSEPFEIILLDNWVSEEGRTCAGFKKNVILFRSKPMTDMRGLNVTVGCNSWPPLVMSSDINKSAISTQFDEGLEIRILKTVAENTNFTFDFQKLNNFSTPYGFFAAQWLVTDRLHSFDATWTHFRGAVTWFIPRERSIPRWQSLIKIFTPSLWLLVLLLCILGSFIFWVLGNTHSGDKETASFRYIIPIFMNTSGMILSASVYMKPKHIRSQVFFFLWSFYCLQINNAYQSSLIGFLTNPGNLPRINDLDGLLESGLELGVQTGMQMYLNDTSDPRNERVLKSYIECDDGDMDLCLSRMAYKGDLAVAGGKIGIEFSAYTKYMKNGKPLFVPFRKNIKEGYMVIYLRKGSILLERIDSIVLRLQNAGIIDTWVKDIRRKFGKHFDNAEFEDGFCVLTLPHFEGAFYLLLLGMFLSVTIWSLEIIHHLVSRRFRK